MNFRISSGLNLKQAGEDDQDPEVGRSKVGQVQNSIGPKWDTRWDATHSGVNLVRNCSAVLIYPRKSEKDI